MLSVVEGCGKSVTARRLMHKQSPSPPQQNTKLLTPTASSPLLGRRWVRAQAPCCQLVLVTVIAPPPEALAAAAQTHRLAAAVLRPAAGPLSSAAAAAAAASPPELAEAPVAAPQVTATGTAAAPCLDQGLG